MSYVIFADVSIDIEKEFAKENDIRYIPMEYTLGEDIFYCTEPESDEMMHNYYDKLRNKVRTQTSQITPNKYMDIFEPLVKEGNSILYISLSSGLSNTYESALLAVSNLKEEYDNVNIEVVDSLSATGGMGLLAESAVANRIAGMSLVDCANWLRSMAGTIQHWVKVEDLMYLKRGGRISATSAIMGTALNIKPIIVINSKGKLVTVDKKRGNKQAIKYLLDKFVEGYVAESGNVVYISCADCMEDAEFLRGKLLEIYPELTVRITMLSPVIGAHTGPDMMTLIFYGNGRVE